MSFVNRNCNLRQFLRKLDLKFETIVTTGSIQESVHHFTWIWFVNSSNGKRLIMFKKQDWSRQGLEGHRVASRIASERESRSRSVHQQQARGIELERQISINILIFTNIFISFVKIIYHNIVLRPTKFYYTLPNHNPPTSNFSHFSFQEFWKI